MGNVLSREQKWGSQNNSFREIYICYLAQGRNFTGLKFHLDFFLGRKSFILIDSMSFLPAGKQTKKRRRVLAPIWWRCGRKRLFFHLLNRHLHGKRRNLGWFHWIRSFNSIPFPWGFGIFVPRLVSEDLFSLTRLFDRTLQLLFLENS